MSGGKNKPIHGRTRALLCVAAAAALSAAGLTAFFVSGCAERDGLADLGTTPAPLYQPAPTAAGDVMTQTLPGLTVNFDMIQVTKGSFKMGCSTGDNSCESTEKDQHDVTLTYDYYISKYLVTNSLWNAVMGTTSSGYGSSGNTPKTSITWYEAVEFTCELSKMTGKKYRLATEAEWEFAARGGTKTGNFLYSGSNDADEVAWHSGNRSSGYGGNEVGKKKPNELGLYDMSGNVYEWTFDNWRQGFPSEAITDPLAPHKHTQKVRRGGSAGVNKSDSRVSARKIRSIEGADGEIGIRLALSVADSRPVGMDDPCTIHMPPPTGGKIGLRDERLITGSDEAWVNDMGEFANMDMQNALKIWPDGTARMAMIYQGSLNTYMGGASGEWYTLNCNDLRIVGSSSTTRYVYYLVSPTSLTIMTESGNPFGRFEKVENAMFKGLDKVTAPTVASPRSAEALAALTPADKNVDMINIPESIRGKDTRLIEGTANGWWQNNESAGGTHNYRKDFDDKPNNARFVVYDPTNRSWTPLAEGEWFTVANTFLRILQKSGSSTLNFDYLYTVSSDGESFNHISFQKYEPGDFRMFKKTANDKMCNRHGCWFDGSGSFFNQGYSTYLPPLIEGYPDQPKTSIAERERVVR